MSTPLSEVNSATEFNANLKLLVQKREGSVNKKSFGIIHASAAARKSTFHYEETLVDQLKDHSSLSSLNNSFGTDNPFTPQERDVDRY